MQENAALRAQVAQVMFERDELEQRLQLVGVGVNATIGPKCILQNVYKRMYLEIK